MGWDLVGLGILSHYTYINPPISHIQFVKCFSQRFPYQRVSARYLSYSLSLIPLIPLPLNLFLSSPFLLKILLLIISFSDGGKKVYTGKNMGNGNGNGEWEWEWGMGMGKEEEEGKA